MNTINSTDDPLDSIFVTGDDAAQMRTNDLDRRLAEYIRRMPRELQVHLARRIDERIAMKKEPPPNE